MATVVNRPIEEARKLLQKTRARTPVNPVAMAHELGVTVKVATFADPRIVGALLPQEGEWTVFIRSSDNPRRQRFTVAHELGHYVLHRDGHPEGMFDDDLNFLRTDGNIAGDKEQEKEANLFAAELLMPENAVRTAYESVKDISALARLFAVSQEAMGYRVLNLGLR